MTTVTSTSLESKVSADRRAKDISFTSFLVVSIVASLAFIFTSSIAFIIMLAFYSRGI